jgi:lipid-A-disaccharide synthase
MTLIYLVAGEASGDLLGGRLMAALKRRAPDLDFAGIGGERMAAEGLHSLFPMRELSLMGLLEVLPSLRRLARRLAETEADVLARRPAVVVTIDAPGFTLRLAGRLRRHGIKVVHYVAPQVWAWRPGRVKRIATEVDEILTLLPFEAPFFAQAGIRVQFVGHPVLESGADRGDAARFRARHGITPEERVVLVMPGSRRGEVRRLGHVFGAALQRLAATEPGIRPVVALAGPVEETVRAATAHWPVPPILVQGPEEKADAYAAAAAGLIKSGTSSLEVALAGVPHIVGYRVNEVTARIAWLLLKVRYASLVNLLLDRMLVPEFIQLRCAPGPLAAGLERLLRDPNAVAAQRAGFAEALALLRPPQGLPSEAAATAVLAAIGR